MKKIKILQVTGSLDTGGIERLVASFYEQVDRNKFQMDFLLYGDKVGELEDKIKKLGGNIYRVPYPNDNYFKFYQEVKKIMINYGPYDVVHSHVLFNTGFIMKAAYKCKIPMRIAHSHDNLSFIKDGLLRKMYIIIMKKYLLKYSTKLCACSSSAGYYLFGEKRFKENGTVIYNSIDIDNFKFDKNRRNIIRKKYSINNEIVVGTIGRLENQKNQKFLIDNFKNIKVDNRKVKLLIVGGGSLYNSFNEIIKSEGLINDIILTGNRKDINDLLCAMDVFVLPSIHEGLGIVLIEAQSNGLPCVASTGAVPEEAKILDSFKFAPYPNNNNFDSWNKLINECVLCGRNEKSINIVKKTGYNIKNISKALEKIYTNLGE